MVTWVGRQHSRILWFVGCLFFGLAALRWVFSPPGDSGLLFLSDSLLRALGLALFYWFIYFVVAIPWRLWKPLERVSVWWGFMFLTFGTVTALIAPVESLVTAWSRPFDVSLIFELEGLCMGGAICGGVARAFRRFAAQEASLSETSSGACERP